MGQVDVHALVEVGLSGVVTNIRTAVDVAGKVVFAVQSVAAIQRGLVREVVVHAGDGRVGVLRRARPGITWRRVGYRLSKRRVGRYRRWAWSAGNIIRGPPVYAAQYPQTRT